MAESNEVLVKNLGRKLVDIIDGLLNKGDWDSSLFLRTSRKRLEELREEAKDVSSVSGAAEVDSFTIFKRPPASGYVRIYISVYQVSAKNLGDWQTALRSLVGHNVTRPIYREEEDAQKSIRPRADINRYGYAIVNVKEEDIYLAESVATDAFGTPLINLKEGAVKLENIVGFVHANKERYSFQDGKLVLENV